METDVMEIDPGVIESTCVLVERYMAKQKAVLMECRSKINSMSSSWTDDSGFGEMNKTISFFVKNAIEELEQIDTVYRKYLLDKAIDIRENLAAIGRK